MNIDVETKSKWVGRKGWNLRFSFQIWKNFFCELPDVRGIESSENPDWFFYRNDICGMVFHSKKEFKKHIKEHYKESNNG